jgi:hypothetical protein
VKDVDFATDQIVIRDGKGHQDRVTMLPAAGLAMGLPRHPSLRRARHQPEAPTPPPQIRAPAGGEGCRPCRQDRQAGDVPHVPSLVCHPPAGGEPRDVSTMMIYTHVLNRGPAGGQSPADRMFL